MSDLPERLRRLYVQTGMNYVQEAADEIERLRERLRIVADECDEHAYWRQKLADDLHDRETQIIELRRQLAEAEQRFDWLATRLEDVQIDDADPNDHYHGDEEDVPYPVLWKRAVNAAMGANNEQSEHHG